MNIVFFGSSEFSIPFLDSFTKDIELVVTSPDKVRGRGKRLLSNPVKDFAQREHLPVITVDKLREQEYLKIKSVSPEIFLVVSYGKIISQEVLSLAKCALNLHPSKLPLYRGAAPIERQIMDGVEDSAVCIIKVIKQLDAGSIIIEEPFKILPFETKEDVGKKIVKIGVPLLRKAIEIVSLDRCEGKEQEGVPTYAKKITKSDELITWSCSGLSIYNKIRALSPVPGAYTYFRQKFLKIFKTELATFNSSYHPGTVFNIAKDCFYVSCGEGSIKVLDLQIEGGKKMSAKDFINGFKIHEGEMFGWV